MVNPRTSGIKLYDRQRAVRVLVECAEKSCGHYRTGPIASSWVPAAYP
jgi:hypothetical protein